MAGIKAIPDIALTWPLCVAGRHTYTQLALWWGRYTGTQNMNNGHWHLLVYIYDGIEHRSWENALPQGYTPSLYYLNFTDEDTNAQELI